MGAGGHEYRRGRSCQAMLVWLPQVAGSQRDTVFPVAVLAIGGGGMLNGSGIFHADIERKFQHVQTTTDF